MKIQTFTLKGTKAEDTNLPKEYDGKINLPLLAQALYVYEKRDHVGLRKTKTRAEINRTTKKVYKQKGTGGARHGSRRANLFVGGGVALGPRPVKRVLTLPNDIKSKAKVIAFASKAAEKQIVCVSGISKLVKTKETSELLKAVTKATAAKRFTFVLSEKSRESIKAIRNLANAKYIFIKDINALDIHKGGMLIMDDEIFATKVEEPKVKKEVVKKAVKKVVKETK